MCVVSNGADSRLSIITFYYCPNSCSALSTVVYEAYVRQTAQPVGQGSLSVFHVHASEYLWADITHCNPEPNAFVQWVVVLSLWGSLACCRPEGQMHTWPACTGPPLDNILSGPAEGA